MTTENESAALYSIEDAARVLGKISSWTVRKHLKRGTLLGVRIGRRVFVSAKEIKRVQISGLPSLSAARAPENQQLRREARRVPVSDTANEQHTPGRTAVKP